MTLVVDSLSRVIDKTPMLAPTLKLLFSHLKLSSRTASNSAFAMRTA